MLKTLMLSQSEIDTPLGRMLLARDAQGLCGVWFEAQKYHPGPLSVPRDDADPCLRQAADWLHAYFDGSRRAAAHADGLPPMSLIGTPFQQSVWRALLDIPSGETVSYGELADRLGCRAAVRAVAAAVGRNPLSVLVPCHRVIGSNGQLTGYAGGLPRKQALLALECHQQLPMEARATDPGAHPPPSPAPALAPPASPPPRTSSPWPQGSLFTSLEGAGA
ncbi:hypothetical protein CDN98_04485 [Roseateles terrae]|uniref:Methylated-DNA--protein-cysteine methyltransferase n=1 Tax=Roseateles terrae TaxID=431060 RepID=A0ABR6GLJ3_9BURK|nr:methylated-DNA-[protein]-cysteine S-methyltransferase [Roseateles terrae]OWQ89774.1 hypothetical protein CDN98_04485 [Roseateles terrae]